ncbi:MAG TPA: glutathione S-transferase N-terminal domain-containing protein [Oxalicibacterium sp.]|nr:glutathione S-transferase N-terminal domain-containing protein [Oxalicibacterium sp.]
MITLYTWTTPNGRKPAILLEELGWPYQLRAVDLSRNEQFAESFLAISPNNKIPAMVDDAAEGGPLALFESGAILTYLADKSGCFLPASGRSRYEALAWLHWQIGNLGPMFGQLGYFAVRAKEKSPPAIQRFTEEGERLLGVMETRLSRCAYLGGDEYTIADIAAYPWTAPVSDYLKDVLVESLNAKPAVRRWLDAVGTRPAVERGMAILQK